MRFWKFIANGLKSSQEETPLDIQQEDQSSSDSESNSSGKQGEEQSEEGKSQSNDSETNSLEEQNGEKSQENGQASSESQNDNSETQSGEQSPESEQPSSNQQNNSSGKQDEEEYQENEQSSGESQNDALEEQSEEEPQEGKKQSSDSQNDNLEGQSEEQSPESEQPSSNQQNNSSGKQGEEGSQENEQSSGESQNDASEGQSEEELQEDENQSDNPQDDISEEQIEELVEEIENSSKLTNEQKKQLLEKLKKSIEEIRKRKALKLKKQHPLSEQSNNFLNQLRELPSFKDRERSPGYAIDTESSTEVPESLIRTLITKFLNQRFCIRNTDLNVRSHSLEKSYGFYKWNVKDVIVDSKTHQLNKVLNDKYGYDYSNSKDENVPLSFYFDMSGSMNKYTNMLAVIAIELVKKKVKVLIGFNEIVNVQIESIEKNVTVEELAKILKSIRYCEDSRVKSQYIERNMDDYLIDKRAEKCVVFADCDPIDAVIHLSKVANVYWFCFESSYDTDDIKDFQGFIYNVQNLEELALGLIKVNENRFEALRYIENSKALQKEQSK